MKCQDMMVQFEKQFPPAAAESWDNVGLLLGRRDKEIKTVYAALDATDEVVEAAISCNADLLLTHHPLIFSPLKRINTDDFISRRVIALLKNDISYYAMHTNYDVCRMSKLAAEYLSMNESQVLIERAPEDKPQTVAKDSQLAEALHKMLEAHPCEEAACAIYRMDQSAESEGLGRVGKLNESMTLRACCALVKERFLLENVKAFGDMDKQVEMAAIFPGSGKSAVDAAVAAGADVMITGDIDHHTGIDAVAKGIALIDAGHYGIEHIFMQDIKRFIERNWEGVTVYTPPRESPFQIV